MQLKGLKHLNIYFYKYIRMLSINQIKNKKLTVGYCKASYFIGDFSNICDCCHTVIYTDGGQTITIMTLIVWTQ